MGFTIETGISALTVFVQGLLSFFSPCVLPLVPLYLGYLSGGIGQEEHKAGERMRLFIRVLFLHWGSAERSSYLDWGLLRQEYSSGNRECFLHGSAGSLLSYLDCISLAFLVNPGC